MPMKNNISRISFIVHEKKIFNVSDNLIVGISGGQDSILLLIVLCHLKKIYQLKINLVYCNHLWQKKNFYALFELLKISYTLNTPINHIITKIGIGSEEEGHFWRQKNFFQLGNYFNIPFIVLGHSATDQIETALWHFFRGTSPTGLTSLKILNSFQLRNFENKLTKLNFYNTKSLKRKFLSKRILSTTRSASLTQLSLKARSTNLTQYFNKPKQMKLAQISLMPGMRSFSMQSKIDYWPIEPMNRKVINLVRLVLSGERYSYKPNGVGKKKYFVDKNETFFYFYNIEAQTHQNSILQRPLLDFYRSSISTLINQNQLPFINDVTNQSKRIIRNKIRLILIPLFHYYIQNKSEIHIKNFLNITNLEQKYLNTLSITIIESYINNPSLINSLFYLPSSIQKLCIKKILEKYTFKQLKLYYIEEIYASFQNKLYNSVEIKNNKDV